MIKAECKPCTPGFAPNSYPCTLEPNICLTGPVSIWFDSHDQVESTYVNRSGMHLAVSKTVHHSS